jgi:peptidoglycan/xylan/chitin deacetylase (PgdA/CDA1 family)
MEKTHKELQNRTEQDRGVFTVSLDFELYWGMRDKFSIEQYKNNLQGVWEAVPEMLRMFSAHDIHATWATVGFIFFNDADDLNRNIPKLLPTYHREEFSPYKYIKALHDLEAVYHFAPELIELILEHNGQEIGTHTFSHYYCLEDGQSLVQFEEDIFSAIEIAKRKGVSIKSLVFPRNQWNVEYLSMINKLGIQCYRGNESSWIYNASDDAGHNKLRRAIRLIDAYLNLSGHNTYDLKSCIQKQPFNFPASRFLRPYSKSLSFLDSLRLRRIKNAMEDAAINKRIFHLWWHPHNFGINLHKNIDFFEKILEYYNLLKKNHGMISLNMSELCLLSGDDNGE